MEAQLDTRRSSRAQAIRDSVEIRLAVNEAGPAIKEILRLNGIDLAVEWDKVFPNWLIATVDDDVVGCCQVLIGKPVGFIEFLFVKPDISFKLRAVAIRKLLIQGFATLQMAGCQMCGGVVDAKNRKFAEVIEKLQFSKTYQADLFVKRLAWVA